MTPSSIIKGDFLIPEKKTHDVTGEGAIRNQGYS